MNNDAFYAVLSVIVVIVPITIPIIAFQAWRIHDLKLKAKRTKNGNDRFFAKYKTLVGWSIKWGAYHYVTLDGGQHWYATEASGDGRRITGDADPQHISEIHGLQALVDDVRTNGPVNLGDPARMSKLTQAGFTVTNN